MTTLNLNKDPIALLLLKNIIRTTSQISVHDTALNQQIAKLTQAYSNPLAVDYDGLVAATAKLSEIVAGYGLDEEKESGSEEPTLGSLSGTLYTFKAKLDELKTATDVDSKHFASVIEQVEEFYKLACWE